MKKYILYTALYASCLFSFTACEDFLNPESDNVLVDEDYIGNVNELYSGYIGIAARVQSVADHAIILSELRGDLLEPTNNAPQDLWDIYFHRETNENPFTNPKGYYDVIMNANIYIQKAFEYKNNNPNAVDNAIFEPLVSSAIRYKVWAYLMLGKLYGEAVYMDEPFTDQNDISKFPTLQFDALILQLISLMDEGHNGISGKQDLVWSDVLFQGGISGDRSIWNMITPSPEPLEMELNLWAGNYQRVVDIGIPFIYDGGSNNYKVDNDYYNGEWKEFFFREPDTKVAKELINVVPFNYERNQMNRLISYFSNTYPADYYLRPTEAAINRFMNQTREDGITKNDFYRGTHNGGTTFRQENGEWVFYKYSRDPADVSAPREVHRNDVHIILYRATDLHFFIAEALNNLGKFPEAEAFLNDGIEGYLSRYAGNLRAPLNDTIYNTALNTNWGIRGRVDLNYVYPENITKEELASENATRQDSLDYMKALDILLVEETAMESAGESRSYFAMIRVAKRWDDPSILADRVSAKYEGGKQQEIHDRLMDPNNWFVNYDLSGLETENE